MPAPVPPLTLSTTPLGYVAPATTDGSEVVRIVSADSMFSTYATVEVAPQKSVALMLKDAMPDEAVVPAI